MPRPKREVPTPKHVTAVDKIKRAAHIARPKPKPRVKLGTKAAADLGIK